MPVAAESISKGTTFRAGAAAPACSAASFWTASRWSALDVMLYRSNTLRVLWPDKVIATCSDTPARMRLRTAERRRSWTSRPGRPALRQAARHES
jgi:hypothetical protein